MSVDNSQHSTVFLIITGLCNLNCKYCYESHKQSAEMSFKTITDIICNELKNLKGHILELIYIGGEPLLRFDFIKEVSEWTWHNFPKDNYFFSLRTNGILLNEEMKSWLAKNNTKIKLNLSLDGIDAVQLKNRGAELKSIDIDFFIKTWPATTIRATLFKDTIANLFDSVIYLHSLGAKILYGIGEGFEWDDDSVKLLEREYNKIIDFALEHPDWEEWSELFSKDPIEFYSEDGIKPGTFCGISNAMTAYWTTGENYPCVVLSPIVLGNKMSESFAAINKPQRSPVDPQCYSCPIVNQCKNCVGMNYKITGSIDKWAARVTTCKAYKVLAKACAKFTLAKIDKKMQANEHISDIELLAAKKSIRLLQDPDF